MKYSFPFDLSKISINLKKILSDLKKVSFDFSKLPFDPNKIKKYLPLILCALLAVIILVCCTAGNADDGEILTYIVSSDSLDVHKKCSTDSRVLGQLPADLEIEVLEQKTVEEINWGRIDKTKLPDGTKVKAGWIDLEYVRLPGEPVETEPVVEPTEPEPEAPAVIVNMGTVTAGNLHIRKGADSGYESVGTYPNGARIEILETKTADGTEWGRTNLGWVSMGYVRMDGTAAPESDTAEDPTAAKVISNGENTVLGYGVINLGELNVRLGPDTKYGKVSTVTMGTRYAYYQLADGWARIEDGWVSTEYFYIEGTTAANAFTGTVNTDELNIRTGPNTSFQNIGTYKQGETVEILAQVDAWGYTEKGWVFMTYVEPVAPTYTTGTGVTTSGLNIRQEPNAEAEIVATYTEGEPVTILEVQEGWGRTDKGWINLKFVEYD